MAALYLHVPFRAPPSSSEVSNIVGAMGQEMEHYDRAPYSNTSFRTLYVGGGRPSHLSESALRALVETLRKTLGTTTIEETTLELHPSDASPSFLSVLRKLGITRLSIDGRSSDEAEVRRVLRTAREAEFRSLSVDLSFGDGERSLSAWKARLHRAVEWRAPHLTLHERAADENRNGEDEHADQFAFAMRYLQAKGYEQYELTHFAHPGHRSRYQEHVYAHGNVLGLGPGAESFWWPDRSDPSTAERWSNVPEVAAYVDRLHNDASPVAQREDLSQTALAREYILLRLRTSDGLDLDVLDDRYDFSLRERRATALDRLAAEGLIHNDPDRVRLTSRGRLLADAVTRRLIREA